MGTIYSENIPTNTTKFQFYSALGGQAKSLATALKESFTSLLTPTIQTLQTDSGNGKPACHDKVELHCGIRYVVHDIPALIYFMSRDGRCNDKRRRKNVRLSISRVQFRHSMACRIRGV